MIQALGTPPLEDPLQPPPDLPPVQPGGEGGGVGGGGGQPLKGRRQAEPYEAAVASIKAVLTPGLWARCSAWWARLERDDPAAGKGLDMNQRLSLYLQAATLEHYAADLSREPEDRRYAVEELLAVDVREILRREKAAISSEAARAHHRAVVARLVSEKAPLNVMKMMAAWEEELNNE